MVFDSLWRIDLVSHVGLRGVFEDEAMMCLAVADAIMQV
jgi:hypothetical protein